MKAAHADQIRKWIWEAVEPDEDLMVWEWAEQNIRLPSEESEAAGAFSTSLTPYMREPLECYRDPNCKKLVLMCGTQVMKTMVLMVGMGWYLTHRSERAIWMMDTESNARDFSENRWTPIIEESPVLAALKPAKRDQFKKLMQRLGGSILNFIGSNSPGNIASRPAGLVNADEVDKFDKGTDEEGDAITQLVQRTKSRSNAFVVESSTPTNENGLIWRGFRQGTMEEYMVSCVHCSKEFCFDTDVSEKSVKGRSWIKVGRLVWDNTAKDPETGEWDLERVKRTAAYECPHCGGKITDVDKHVMVSEGRWVPTNPNPMPGVRSFHIASINSPWVSCAFGELAITWLKHKHEFDLDNWDRYYRGWPTFQEVEKIDSNSLVTRREDWIGIPDEVELCTIGIDTQDDRLECTEIGWADGLENWTIEHAVLWGDTSQIDVWNDLEDWLMDRLGRTGPRITAACIDTGGHQTDAVYQFVRRMRGRFPLHAIKGANREAAPIVGRPSRPNKYGVRLTMVGTNAAKERVHGMFRVKKPGSGYCHFHSSLDEEHFLQLTAEELRVKWKKGRRVESWEKVRERNEALDCFVYALAALHIRGLRFLGHSAPAQQTDMDLPSEPEKVPEEKPKKETVQNSASKMMPRGPAGGGFVNGF